LDRLRGVFARRGVAISSVGLAGTLAATTTSGALPTGLGAAITAAAFTATSSLVITATPTTLTTMFNLKVVATVLSAAILTGTGTYLFQQRQITRLQQENRRLVVEHARLAADQEAIMKSAQENRDQVQQSQKDLAELLRLRNQVGQMRREQEAHKRQEEQRGAQALSPAAPTEAAYISKDQLAFVGYGTPEAALQSLTWAMTKGTYDQALAGLSPQVQEEESKDPTARQNFEESQKKSAALLKGMQILARKTLSDEKVELKIRLDSDPDPNNPQATPGFLIQPMSKIGDEWKLGGSTHEYSSKWDEEGQIQSE
jgi:hypothetical protein